MAGQSIGLRVRGFVPERLHDISRAAYLRVGVATAGLRLQPNAIMIGASRCGTTTLFRALATHPRLFRPPVNKGVQYFDLNYPKGETWYRGHFPITKIAQSRTRGHTPIAFEASGYYMFHPLATQRISADLPGVRLIAMVRNPVERAWSAWKHETARGFETEPFARALDLEAKRLRGEEEKIIADPRYHSMAHQHLSHRARGEYANQLERIFQHVPADRVHVIQAEAFFAHPQREYRRLVEFLHLPWHNPGSFPVRNARPSDTMPATIRQQLKDHYQSHNDRLEALIGATLHWD
ncbi:MAG: sulfotransferase family protein [Actinomycetota bacterium]